MGKLNTELQRGLLRTHAEVAQRKGLWLRLKSRPEFTITPAHFFELLNQGRFETTSPNDWEMFEETAAEEAAAVTKEKEIRMEMATTEQPVTRRRNGRTTRQAATTDIFEAGLLRLKELKREKESVQTTYDAAMARIESQRTSLMKEILGHVGGWDKVHAAEKTILTTPIRRRVRRATGIREAIITHLLAVGVPQTTKEIAAALKPTFRGTKVEKNIWPMISERILFRNEQSQLNLGPGWKKTKAFRTQAQENTNANKAN